jgi:hypothetical protein
LNTAAILREEARISKIENEERSKLDSKLLALRDASEFNAWQAKMRQKDEIERVE